MIKIQHKPLAEINVVPYIDVMLVLLVIFMITTPLLQEGVEVNLPQAKAKAVDSVSQRPLVVSVDKEGNYFLNVLKDPNKAVSIEEIVLRVAAELRLAERDHLARPSVLVKGDNTVSYGQVVQAMVLLQQVGVPQVGLLTEVPATKLASKAASHA